MKTKFILLIFLIAFPRISPIFSQGENVFLFNPNNIKANTGDIYSNLHLFSFPDIVNNRNQINERSSFSVRLDSTIDVLTNGDKSKTSYNYILQDKIKSFYIYYWINYQWENGWQIINSYDSTGKLVNGISAIWDNSKWFNFSRETYFYNSDGKLEHFSSEFWQAESWIKHFKESYFYDSNGNVVTILDQTFKDSVYVNTQRISYSFGLIGVIDSSLFETWDGKNWQNEFKIKYDYDNQGRRISAVKQIWNNDKWDNNFRGSLGYDSNSNIILGVIDIWSGNKWNNLERFLFNYNSNNNFISGFFEYFINNKWVSGDGAISFTAPNGFVVGTVAAKLFAYYSTITEVRKNDINSIRRFNLHQNYPNPFNPTTAIKYSISTEKAVIPVVEIKHALSVQLNIYNVLGKKIATLVNKYQMPGDYSVIFDASNLPSGVYFYKLQVGTFTDVKKMLLTK